MSRYANRTLPESAALHHALRKLAVRHDFTHRARVLNASNLFLVLPVVGELVDVAGTDDWALILRMEEGGRVSDFVAVHEEHGRVWGNFARCVWTTKEDGLGAFVRAHPTTAARPCQ